VHLSLNRLDVLMSSSSGRYIHPTSLLPALRARNANRPNFGSILGRMSIRVPNARLGSITCSLNSFVDSPSHKSIDICIWSRDADSGEYPCASVLGSSETGSITNEPWSLESTHVDVNEISIKLAVVSTGVADFDKDPFESQLSLSSRHDKVSVPEEALRLSNPVSSTSIHSSLRMRFRQFFFWKPTK
jgi:hypothetical protein